MGKGPLSDVAIELTGTKRFLGFDGLRAIAILLVVLWHSAIVIQFPQELMGPLRPIVMSGWMGVDLFFALSGFLITSLLLREEARNEEVGLGQRFSIGGFYLRRSLRILPVFLVVFLIQTFVLSGYLPSVNGDEILKSGSAFGVWPYATFWGNYFVAWKSIWKNHLAVHAGLGYQAYWSLCVEEHFYLLWPVFLLLVKRSRLRIAIAVSACVLMCAARFVVRVEHLVPHQHIHTLSHYRMDSILWGALGALVVTHVPAVTAFRTSRLRRTLLALLAAIALLLVALGGLTVLPPPSAFGTSIGLSVLAMAATLLLVELISSPDSMFVRILELRPLTFIGRLSYAMYLIHFQAIDLSGNIYAVEPSAPTISNLLGYFSLNVGISIAIAYVLHILVERPFLLLKERLRVRRVLQKVAVVP